MIEGEAPIRVRKPLADLVARLRAHYGTRVHLVALYGSVARGTSTPESDVDVLVVLDRIGPLQDRLDAYGIAADVNLESELMFELQVLGQDELDFLRRTETLLARNLDRDGIVMWQREVA